MRLAGIVWRVCATGSTHMLLLPCARLAMQRLGRLGPTLSSMTLPFLISSCSSDGLRCVVSGLYLVGSGVPIQPSSFTQPPSRLSGGGGGRDLMSLARSFSMTLAPEGGMYTFGCAADVDASESPRPRDAAAAACSACSSFWR